jgi:hypothetical protein
MNDPTNEFSSISNPSDTPLPTGLIMALAQNMHAMEDYAKLSDAGRQRLIDQAASTHSREEMQALVRNISQFL